MEKRWPCFSGEPADLAAIKETFDEFSFNALDFSDDDLTVIIGELFHQASKDFGLLTSTPTCSPVFCLQRWRGTTRSTSI